MKLYSFLCIIILFVSCAEETTEISPKYFTNLTIISGTSFGHCVGYCNSRIEITEETIEYSKYSRDETKYPAKQLSEKNTINKWNEIVNSFDLLELSEMKDIYGCPDCADGGAEWVEVKFENFSKKIIFEYGDNLPEIQNLLKNLRKIRTRFEDQLPE